MRSRAGVRFVGVFFAHYLPLFAASSDFDRARNLYELTQFEESLKALSAIPIKTPPIYELMGQNYFMNGDYKKSTDALERAVQEDPGNSDYVMWLGRAYGRRAETSNPFSAIGHASKARQYFERAVQLNPKNIEALNDLLEYYLEAPGFMGGGIDKAQAVINRISQVDPSEGHWAQSTLDEKRKEYGKAEQQLRRALELAPSQVSRFMDLAKFLFKQGRYQEGEQNFAHAEQIAPENAKLLFVRADCYVKAGRNLDTAKQLLQRYLNSPVTPDDPPKADARKLLRQIQGG